jgi:hypothetical protein
MDDAYALSLTETESRFNERQKYLERALGYHATAKGKALYDECIPRVAEFIRKELEKPDKTHPSGLRPVLKRLKNPELIALSALTALLQSIPIRHDEDLNTLIASCVAPRLASFRCRRRRNGNWYSI